MPKYIVTTQSTDLRVHADHHTYSPIIGSLPKGKDVEVVEVFHVRPVGQWMKLGPSERFAGGWAYAGDQLQFLKLDDILESAPSAAATVPPSPEEHILLFFGGACPVVRPRTHSMAPPRYSRISCLPGADMRTHDDKGKRTSQTAYEHFTPEGRFAAKHSWNPAVSNSGSNPAVDAGFRFLSGLNSVPGKLVIYGFSAGGFNAVRLCERVAETRGRQVDLLITVDPCIQDIDPHGELPIHRPTGVTHFNWYQTSAGEHYSGRLVPGAVNAPPQTPPPDRNRSAHDQMPVFTMDFVEAEIANVLEKPTRALNVPP